MNLNIEYTDIGQKYPEFINTDPRVSRSRKYGYQVNSNFMFVRHCQMFSTVDLRGKTVLDLGSCTGYTGGFVLENGAKYYRGVELHPDLAQLSKDNLSNNFSQEKWDITIGAIEESLDIEFDIVVASGILYTFFDSFEYIKKIASVTKEVLIVDSYHPSNILNSLNWRFLSKSAVQNVVENIPYIMFYPVTGNDSMLWGNKQESITYPRCNPSAGFVKHYMEMLSFSYSDECNLVMKEKFPHVYAHEPEKRYMLIFQRKDNNIQSMGLKDSLADDNFKIIKWDA